MAYRREEQRALRETVHQAVGSTRLSEALMQPTKNIADKMVKMVFIGPTRISFGSNNQHG